MIPSCFPCLSTLTTSLKFIELRFDGLESSKTITEGLKVVDTGFRDTLSVLQITIEIHEGGLTNYIMEEVNSRGCKISIIKKVEEEDCDRSLTDSEDGNNNYRNQT
jgi:hypothetical protein